MDTSLLLSFQLMLHFSEPHKTCRQKSNLNLWGRVGFDRLWGGYKYDGLEAYSIYCPIIFSFKGRNGCFDQRTQTSICMDG